MSAREPRSLQFRRERMESWRELKALVERVEKSGPKGLSAEEMMRLPVLYRAGISSLSVARAISLDRSLLEYLESLNARAYFCVYGLTESAGRPVFDFFRQDLPRAVRAIRWQVLICSLLMLAGTVTGFVMTNAEPGRFRTFVPDAMAQGRGPFASNEELREVLYAGDEQGDDELVGFSGYLFQHNARIGILAFALGVLFGVPVVYLMFTTGLMLGAFASIYHARDLGAEFWGWILPHGVTELGAAILCAAAGLTLGQTVLFSGPTTRLTALARRSRAVSLVAMGALGMFLMAGLIEGVFRQRVQGDAVRYALATSTLVLWIVYFTRFGRGR